ncbi:hypothetical protein BJF79_18040 [Actinomadura sp. CNU-125]|uniref:hypothetical protein n=1 Tax=Actinomadura sp. CNU-125 TaxID=1904961 RepID=UPI00095A15D3|nr:hypothetical protein [Actinomadura sp. CNU-125]OLT17009.1 hypothetical protein BJF79_18040 [Actinomadura sp. CNU-125]
MTTAARPAARRATERPVPRWAERVAHLVPLTVLPSGLWRVALGVGVPMGFAEGSDMTDFPHPIGTPYVFALSILSECLALLTLGLVRPWGEVFPHWLPLIGGRRVPVSFAVGAASLGAVAVTLIGFAAAANWTDAMAAPEAPTGAAGVVMTLAYAPFLAWGPLLAIVTVHYFMRRVRGAAETAAAA